MTQATLYQSGFSTPITTSNDMRVPTGHVLTSTNTQRCQIFQLHPKLGGVEERGYKDIETLVEKFEADPDRKAAMERARVRLGEYFSTDRTETIRSVRLKRGLSQAKLGSIISSTQAHIARIEAGSDIQISTLLKLAKALELAPSDALEVFIRTSQVGLVE